MKKLKGKDIIIEVDGFVVAGCKNCEVTSNVDLIEVSSISSGRCKSFIAGMEEWSIMSNHLIYSVREFMLRVGANVNIKLGHVEGSGVSADNLSGTAIVKSCKLSANVRNMAQGNIVFQGSGPLE